MDIFILMIVAHGEGRGDIYTTVEHDYYQNSRGVWGNMGQGEIFSKT